GMIDVLPQYTASKEVFRDKIRNERDVELCFEQHRWYDLRRWRIAKQALSHIYNVEITRTGNNQFSYHYYEDVARNRGFDDRNYWYPIPRNYVDMLKNLEQNPGW